MSFKHLEFFPRYAFELQSSYNNWKIAICEEIL